MSSLLSTIAPHCKFVIADKKFALAGKIFEYIFEPAVAGNNHLFYSIGFHKYIANLLYAELLAQPASAAELFSAFQTSMRELDFTRLGSLLGGSDAAHPEMPPSALVVRFATLQKDAITLELESLGNHPVGKWVLELSTTCLDGLLSYWGENLESMQVICDDSKPLKELQLAFTWRVGPPQPKHYIQIGEARRLLTYNLAAPIEFGKSKDHAGLQLADVVASSVGFAMTNKDDSDAKAWVRVLDAAKCMHVDSVFAQPERADLSKRDAVLNGLVLAELVQRAERREPLLDNMPEFIRQMTADMGDILKMLSESK